MMSSDIFNTRSSSKDPSAYIILVKDEALRNAIQYVIENTGKQAHVEKEAGIVFEKLTKWKKKYHGLFLDIDNQLLFLRTLQEKGIVIPITMIDADTIFTNFQPAAFHIEKPFFAEDIIRVITKMDKVWVDLNR